MRDYLLILFFYIAQNLELTPTVPQTKRYLGYLIYKISLKSTAMDNFQDEPIRHDFASQDQHLFDIPL